MIKWEGQRYRLSKVPYNGTLRGYLLGKQLYEELPDDCKVRGYIFTENGVIAVMVTSRLDLILVLIAAFIILFAIFNPHIEYSYFPVTFSPTPVYADGVLYCNVVNESGSTVVVQFRDGERCSRAYSVPGGESLAYCSIKFAPTEIIYNGKYAFPLQIIEEVAN